MMGNIKSILMSGYYGFDNSGDDAILKAIVKDFKELNKDIDITILSNNPSKTESMYPVKAVNRFSIRQVIKVIKSTSLFISGGGSLLQDVTSTRSLLYYLAVMTLAKFFNKPVMVYANGIGPINRRTNRLMAKWVLNRVDLITLRDEDSKSYLKGLDVKNERVYVTADPVFTLSPLSDDKIIEILEKEGIPRDNKLIGISVRSWKSAENLEEVMAKAIDYIISTYDAKVVLIPMHYPEDLGVSRSIMKNVKLEGCFTLENKYSVEEIMGIIKELDLIVAMRLHSLIYAATQAIPMVGLVYDPKIEGILKDIGMEYMCNVESLNYEELVSKIDYVWENKDKIKSELVEQSEKLKDMALQNISYAYELLGR